MKVDAFGPALNGIHRGMQGLQQNAQQISSATTPTKTEDAAGDIEKPMVEMISNERQVEASAKVVKTQDEMLGTLLDKFA